MLPTPSGCGIKIANYLPQGLILMKMALRKIGERGVVLTITFFEQASSTYHTDFWGTLITTNFKKKHVELFCVFSKLA
jgi:hypothetical protein